MRSRRPALFRKRQFEPIIIVTCVRWYFRFSLSLRDLISSAYPNALMQHFLAKGCVSREIDQAIRRLPHIAAPEGPVAVEQGPGRDPQQGGSRYDSGRTPEAVS